MDPQLGPMVARASQAGTRPAGGLFFLHPLFSFMLQAVPRAESPQEPCLQGQGSGA